MNEETPPAVPPAAPRVLVLNEVAKTAKTWTLTLHPEHLELLESPATPPYVILRAEVMKSAILIEGMKILTVTKPLKTSFKLLPEDMTALAEWIGKPALALFYIKRRYAWVPGVAIIFLIGSLPISGDAASGAKAIPFDPVGFALALILMVSWGVAKWRPHATLFLVDSIWFLILAGQLVKDVFVTGRSKGWLVFVVFLLWMVVSGLKHFRRFRGTKLARP